MHQNIEGLLNKQDNLTISLENLEKEVDVVCLTEHFVKVGNEGNIQLQGYQLAAAFQRSARSRGGCCILVRDDIEYCVLRDAEELSQQFHFECCAIYIKELNLVLACLYRIPGADLRVFLDKLHIFLSKMSKKDRKIILCGDFNIDIKNSKHSSTKMFMSLLQNFNMVPHIKDFTHVTATSSTCIDNIISNIKGTGRVHFLGLSRHAAQTLTTEAGKQLPRITHWFEFKRDYSAENMNKFISCMSSLSFSEVITDNNFESAFSTFHELLTLFFELCFPKIKMKRNIKRKKPWITRGLKKSCRVKRDMYLSVRSGVNSLSTVNM